nr:DUF6366 family protein [Amphibacillus marinus]
MEGKQVPEARREMLRQQELKKSHLGNLRDAAGRNQGGSLVDLFNSLGWKGSLVLISVLILGGFLLLWFL